MVGKLFGEIFDMLLTTTSLAGRNYDVYQVPLPGRSPVFMSFARMPPPHVHAVVVVDSFKFLALWKNQPGNGKNGFAFGNPASWRSDRKFDDAESGFSKGLDNPVPLADCSCMIERGVPYVSVSGVTRTIWLLANGCAAFPIQCSASEAGLLASLAAASY